LAEVILQAPPAPVIVKIIEPNKDLAGLEDVLFGSLGLTGVLVLLSIVAAVLFAGLLFWFRSRSA
jgi:hypothetical protein